MIWKYLDTSKVAERPSKKGKKDIKNSETMVLEFALFFIPVTTANNMWTCSQFHQHFTYKCCFSSFFYIHVTREKLPKWRLYEKFASKMLMKLTPVVNFTSCFCIDILAPKKYKAKLKLEISSRKKLLYKKVVQKMSMKLTPLS